MGKRVLSRAIPGLAVALGVTVLVIFVLLYAAGEAGLAQRLPQVGLSLSAQPGEGVVAYSLLLSNQEEGEITLDSIEVLLPEGQAYVGLAASSEVNVEPFKGERALVWSGPFILAGEGSLSLDFWAVALRDEASGLSRATLYVGGTAVASAEEEVTVKPWSAPSAVPPVSVSLGVLSTSITVTKSVTPTTTLPNRPVLYTAVFTNSDVVPVDLNTITDTFDPPLVRHVGDAPGSDITDDPEEGWGHSTATWSGPGPYIVPATGSLTLAYYAWVTETLEKQTITNTLQAEAVDGSVGPEEETLDIEIAEVFLPLAMKDFSLVPPVPPAFLEDHFDAHAANWTPFLNYWRLNEEQWYWDAAGGYEGGGYRHNMDLGGTEAHDALSMYIQEGSQEWTDYRLRAKVNLVDGYYIGLWFRGTYVDEGGENGRRLTGYYFLMGSDGLSLWQFQTEDEYEDYEWIYHFAAPMLLEDVAFSWAGGTWYELKVEVEGSLIKCYVDDVLKIEYDDTVGATFLQGTVGLVVYKADDARFDDVLVEPF